VNQFHSSDAVPPSPSLERRIDGACDRFEAAWRAGQRPRIEEFLGDASEPGRACLLYELLALEAEYRRLGGEQPAPEEYGPRFPGHTALVAAALAGPAPGPTATDAARTTPESPRVGDDGAAGRGAGGLASVPGYEVLEELGRGGMGVVYEARQTRLNRLVAVKMIRADAVAGKEARARFLSEARAVARLQHPNIVQVFEVGEAEDQPFFSMEFVEGGSLSRRLSHSPLAAGEAARLVEVLARAMHYAHERGVVHRDLKPANVLLTADGTPKVTDFGLAKQLDQESGQTQTGAMVGTPSYMAPEQAEGRVKDVGPLSDVYALGAILYECLTGRPPFRAATIPQTLRQVVEVEPVAPRDLNPAVPRDLETVCLKCLHKEPSRRYASGADLAEDLRRFQAREPITARPVGPAERLGRWCRRNPAVAGTALALAVTLTVGVVLITLSRNDAWRLAEEKARLADAATLASEANERLAEEKGRLASEESEQRKRVQRQFAWTHFEQSHARCVQEDASRGLPALVLSLRHAVEAEAPDLEEAVRAQLGGWSRGAHPLKHILRHGPAGVIAAFSPDGQTVLTTGGHRYDGKVRLWEGLTPHR
jgi:predicted Ser/Thr protein kinase